MAELTDERIVQSWSRNSAPWVAAVRGRKIASRALVTDAAIVEAVRACAPRTGVDLGRGGSQPAHCSAPPMSPSAISR